MLQEERYERHMLRHDQLELQDGRGEVQRGLEQGVAVDVRREACLRLTLQPSMSPPWP